MNAYTPIHEVDELRAEIERHMREKVALAVLVSKERDDNERLRAALQEIEHETGPTMLATNHGRRGDLANTIARAALSQNPASNDAEKRDKP